MTDAPASSTRTIDFDGLVIAYDHRVLEPRPWTIAQSQWAVELQRSAPGGPVLELFAGVGHMGLAAVHSTGRRLVLVDLNPAACELAAVNVAATGLADRVEVREGRIDEALRDDEVFPVIIADPPWVASASIDRFPEDPQIAIDGGDDGLDLARIALRVVDAHLAEGGAAVLQVGSVEQVDALRADLPTGLRLTDVRTFERGTLALLTR